MSDANTFQGIDLRLARILTKLPEAVLVEDEDRTVLLTNQTFCDFFGYDASPEQLIGMDCSNAAEESKMFFTDPEGFVKRIEELLRKKETVIGDELELVDGRFLLRDYIPVVIENEYKGHAWKYRDITESKSMSNELVRMNQLNNKLFSIIAHDLRGPLTGLSTILSMVQEGDFSVEEFQGLLPDLSRDVDNTSNLVNNLLSWSAAKIQNRNTEPEVLPLKQMADRSIKLLDNFADSKEISIKNYIPDQVKVIGDEGMLDIVIRNLLTNAIKFSNDGASIEVKAESQGEMVKVSIKDEGIGLDKEKQAQLFDHKIGKTSGTKGEKGIGLGLLICKDFIQANGGEIWAEANEDVGSTFYFTIKKHTDTDED